MGLTTFNIKRGTAHLYHPSFNIKTSHPDVGSLQKQSLCTTNPFKYTKRRTYELVFNFGVHERTLFGLLPFYNQKWKQ